MGSFNVSCTASNLSISCGTEIVFLPLIINRFLSNFNSLNTSGFCYNDEIYQPFCLPIIGEYDDYGRIESIKPDANTVLLEHKFGYSIEDILSTIFDEAQLSQKEGYEKLPNLGGMFVLKEVYDNFSKMDLEGYGPDCIVVDSLEYNGAQKVIEEFLIKWGFTFEKEGKQNSYTDRDCKIFSKSGHKVKLNEYNIEIDNKKQGAYETSSFIKQWNEITNDNISLEDIRNISYKKTQVINSLNNNRYTEGLKKIKVFEKDCENIRVKLEEDSENKILLNELEGKVAMVDYLREDLDYNIGDSIEKVAFNFGFRNWKPFTKHYFGNLIKEPNEELIDLLIKFSYFNTMMICGNIMYRPSTNGLQDGAVGVSKYINKVVSDITDKKYDEYKKYQED